MRIAVTGASGFIGRHLVAQQAAGGATVVPIRRPFEASTLTAAFRQFDVVVHLAGLVASARDRDFVAANVAATQVVARAARDANVRLIHISSLAAAGPAPASAPRDEDARTEPITAYGRSKLAGERALHDVAGLRWIALRPGVVYGPGDRAMLPLFRMAAHGWIPLVGSEGAAYTVIHVADVVRAIGAALDADLNHEAVFVGHPSPATARDIVAGIRAAVAPRSRVVRVPMPLTRVAALAGDLAQLATGRPMLINRSRYRELAADGFVCRVDRLRERLGVVAQVGLMEGLAETGAWYRAQGWI